MASTRLLHRRAHGRRCRVLKERIPHPSAKPYSCFSSVASTVAVAPALTVMVLSQVLNPDFASLILQSPTASRRDEGVLPHELLVAGCTAKRMNGRREDSY